MDSVEEEVAAELKQLMDEVWVLGSLSHPSITRFCALVLDPPMIVMQVGAWWWWPAREWAAPGLSLQHASGPNTRALCTHLCPPAVPLPPPTHHSQYYPHGSLFDLLKRGRRGERRALHELSWVKRLDMLRDISSGMVFLHSRKPAIVHGDLRSPNLVRASRPGASVACLLLCAALLLCLTQEPVCVH